MIAKKKRKEVRSIFYKVQRIWIEIYQRADENSAHLTNNSNEIMWKYFK